jgi:hypothetical protein
VISATERLLRAVNPSERGTESGSSETPTSSHSPLLFHGVYRPLGVYIRLGMYQVTQMGSLSARDTIRVRACERCMLATDHAYWNYTYEMRICKRFMSIREACLRAIYSYQRSMSMSNLRSIGTELTDIAGVHRTAPIPSMFTLYQGLTLLRWVLQTLAKPRPTRLHRARRTLAPPAPPSEFPYRRWELSIVPPRLIIYSNRVGLEPNPALTRLLTHNPPRLFALCFCSLRNVF